MRTIDRYEGFADRYDLFSRDTGAREFYRRLFAKYKVTKVLDCACGTGRDLVMFHSLGCEITGSDLSPSMLASASQTLARAGIQVPFHEIDYRNLPTNFDHKFDAVVCLSGSLLECTDEGEMFRALRGMHAVLHQGGLLILTQGMTDKLWREKPRFILEVNSPEVSRVFVIDYLNHGARFNILDIFHSQAESGLKVWSIHHSYIPLAADYQRLLREADFAEVRLLGNYESAPYDVVSSDLLIVVGRK